MCVNTTPCPPPWERVVIVCNDDGSGCVLACTENIRPLVYHPEITLKDLGMELSKGPKLRVWEGELKWVPITGEDLHVRPELSGDIRELTDEEWQAIREDKNPWDDNIGQP